MNHRFTRSVAVALLTAAATTGMSQLAEAGPRSRPPGPKVSQPRPARFVVVGTLGAVDLTTSSITISPTTGGNAKVRPAPVTVTVPLTARVLRDGLDVALSGLVPGDRVAASGTRSGSSIVISKVVATSPAPEPAEPAV